MATWTTARSDPSLGWRYTDAWMSMAGMGDVGEPNGLPVDEWGIRVNEKLAARRLLCCPWRGHQSPAAVYAVEQGHRMAEEVLAAGRCRHDVLRSRSDPGAGQHRAADVLVHRLHRGHRRAWPAGDERRRHAAWRMAPSPHGVYWKEGQKIGYQDAGSWTLMESTPVDRAQAAWLYAQFVTSKTVDLEEVPCWSDVHSRVDHQLMITSPSVPRCLAA
jgi:glycerol transport system substrate-binding protein